MKNVYVAGHGGMVGSALVRLLGKSDDVRLITKSRAELDLTNQAAVDGFFAENDICEVYLAAGRVGGIAANITHPADFSYQNLIMECNILEAAHQHGVQKLLFLGSSCIYPKMATQPIKETELLSGPLEPTNESYAIAKIAGIKLCESYNRQYGRDYRSVMPTNLYGPNDNFHPENSHVIPGLLRRFHEAKERGDTQVTAWGSGKPMREFLHADDMAAASVHVMDLDLDQYQQHTEPMLSHINVGAGVDCSIKELVKTVAQVVGYEGDIAWDASKPDGTPRKLMDNTKLIALGWTPHYNLNSGLTQTYSWYKDNVLHTRT